MFNENCSLVRLKNTIRLFILKTVANHIELAQNELHVHWTQLIIDYYIIILLF